ncbi:MAG: hypothetical protein IJ641_05690 [Lachnospiraceae bacterium]|nr:hypothetical protein [Lachnospiraceae bacterium]
MNRLAEKLKKERRRRIHAEIELSRLERNAENDELEKRRITLEKRVRFFDSFSKVLVAVIVAHGLICVSVSYIYAALNIMEPLQSLSEVIEKEIVGPVAIYGLKAMIENVSKHNNWIELYLGYKYGLPDTPAETSAESEVLYERNNF